MKQTTKKGAKEMNNIEHRLVYRSKDGEKVQCAYMNEKVRYSKLNITGGVQTAKRPCTPNEWRGLVLMAMDNKSILEYSTR